MKTRSRRTVKNTRNTGGEVRQNKKSENEEFYGYIKDLVHHPYVLKMKNYQHHCNTSCYQHCLNVAYYNYKICNFLIWMHVLQQEQVCFMIYFYTIGIIIAKKQVTLFMQ